MMFFLLCHLNSLKVFFKPAYWKSLQTLAACDPQLYVNIGVVCLVYMRVCNVNDGLFICDSVCCIAVVSVCVRWSSSAVESGVNVKKRSAG